MSDHGDYLFMHVRALCLLGESSTDVTAAATADGNSSRVLDTVEKVRNNCFLCSSNGREASECCVKFIQGLSVTNGYVDEDGEEITTAMIRENAQEEYPMLDS